MSIIGELNRIANAKVAIREKFVNRNIQLDENYKIHDLPPLLDQLSPTIHQGEGTLILTNGNKFSNFQKTPYFPILDFTHVTDLGSMFHSCLEITNLNLINFNKENFVNVHYAFYNCRKLNTLPPFDFPNAQNTYNIFSYCLQLTKIDILNAPLAKNLGRSFQNCNNLRQVPTHMSFPSAINVEHFYHDTGITSCSSLNLPEATHCNGIFYNCRNIYKFETETYTFPKALHLAYTFSFINTSNYQGEKFDITLNAPKVVYLNRCFENNATIRKVIVNLGSEERPTNYAWRINTDNMFTNTHNLEEVIFDDCSQIKSPTLVFNSSPKLRKIILPNLTTGINIANNCTSITKELILELFNNAQAPHTPNLVYSIPRHVFTILTDDEKSIITNKGYKLRSS